MHLYTNPSKSPIRTRLSFLPDVSSSLREHMLLNNQVCQPANGGNINIDSAPQLIYTEPTYKFRDVQSIVPSRRIIYQAYQKPKSKVKIVNHPLPDWSKTPPKVQFRPPKHDDPFPPPPGLPATTSVNSFFLTSLR
eukprot:gnl/Hemi2/22736_TR7604_c0_g1_i1.p1 gnl/Hemi2/22736_TR7604_c0_g1~~gnl/Hemi2/22736_TR7604_c0_g1_i1.p1  ORF type:complete len:136 (+),score=34.59 gnl/Hemi2/22736_TR7604_c0_g1_i1:81-488(+)